MSANLIFKRLNVSSCTLVRPSLSLSPLMSNVISPKYYVECYGYRSEYLALAYYRTKHVPLRVLCGNQRDTSSVLVSVAAP